MEFEKVKRVKDLPPYFLLPNTCSICSKFIGMNKPSEYYWVSDGVESIGCCSSKCRKILLQRKNRKE